MNIDTVKTRIPTSPAVIIDQEGLNGALDALAELRRLSGCKILYSIKSLPLTAVLDIVQPYVDGFSVSSLFEAKLADEILAGRGGIHLTTPGLRADEIDELAGLCTHVSFNSLTQQQALAARLADRVSIGLRVNPKLSFLVDDRYNPCRPHSKLGIDIDTLAQWPDLENIRGLHIHTVFATGDYAPLVETLRQLTQRLGDRLAGLEWLNLGGGYLYAQIADQAPLIRAIAELKTRYGVDVYIEPGNSVVGHCGYLLATVIDSFISDGKTVAVLDSSVNHLPEVFEYQLQPSLHEQRDDGAYPVLLAGGTCLAGDLFGEYRFAQPLQPGDRVVFKNVGAYSLVKANRFNGCNWPDIYLAESDGVNCVKRYDYPHYRQQWFTER